ncbi:SMP-30/gluconolactonase/LRE family protein [Sinomonas susongensis]|uniref:SMP-30/gluconolactonase/LRE family protein n=1 Tax=Sinomonas susongensis TaxID=1324851 RepID=UPI0014866E3C|nr:SMP-30/gluconolactonase/LRE family protein [Sinomonas susongensis]
MKIRRIPAPEVAIRSEALVGEGPVWDHRSGRLAWVDLDPGILHISDPSTGADTEIPTGRPLGAVAPRRREGWAAATEDGFGHIEGTCLVLDDLALPGRRRRMNDAKCDPAGRLWAGSTAHSHTAGGGALHVWDGESPSRVTRRGLTLPNGLGWSPDGRTMYLAESAHRTLYSAPFDPPEGHLGALEPLAMFDHGLPDGLCIDAEGCIWLALWGAGEVWRLAPDGTHLATVTVPAPKPSSCAIGPDGTLYITSARRGLEEAQLRSAPLSGSVFALDSGTRPVPIPPFRA